MLKWMAVLTGEAMRLLRGAQENEVSNRWNQLADEFVARGRLDVLDLLEGLDAAERRELLGPGEDTEPSPGLLALYFSHGFGNSGANHEDLDTVRHPSSEDIEALRSLLLDQARMHFVKQLLREAQYTPRELTFELTRAAVYTVDPTFNKHFIQGSLRTDPDGVREALTWFFEHGNAWEVAGAHNVLYWCGRYSAKLDAKELEQHRFALLCRFVEDDDLDLRRSLIGRIDWRRRSYPPEALKLLKAARKIAKRHSDDYIRARFAYDTGKSKLIPPLPHRRHDPPTPTDTR